MNWKISLGAVMSSHIQNMQIKLTQLTDVCACVYVRPERTNPVVYSYLLLIDHMDYSKYE